MAAGLHPAIRGCESLHLDHCRVAQSAERPFVTRHDVGANPTPAANFGRRGRAARSLEFFGRPHFRARGWTPILFRVASFNSEAAGSYPAELGALPRRPTNLARWRSSERGSLIRRRSRVRIPLEPPRFEVERIVSDGLFAPSALARGERSQRVPAFPASGGMPTRESQKLVGEGPCRG